jgi:hypothetical protein
MSDSAVLIKLVRHMQPIGLVPLELTNFESLGVGRST